MKTGLLFGSALLASTAVAHSILGERYILVRLLRRSDLPRLLGSDRFTKRTLRFAWHLTSIAWLGFAAVLLLLAQAGAPQTSSILRAVGATFVVTAAITAAASRGRHLAWPAFLAVGLLAWFAD